MLRVNFRILAVGLSLLLSTTAIGSEPLRIHLISGSKEYKSEPSLKALSESLEKSYAIECTASWGSDGATELAGLESIKDAELMIVFARRLKLGEDAMSLIRAHWEAGKPVIGIRTAGHAFQQADNDVFDRKVLGGNYQGHYGDEAVKVTSVAEHPILEGVKPFTSSKLYKAGELAEGASVLQNGDIGKAKHPVTIVHEYKGGKTFFTALGTPEDFANENFQRMLVNAIFWTTDRQHDKMKR